MVRNLLKQSPNRAGVTDWEAILEAGNAPNAARIRPLDELAVLHARSEGALLNKRRKFRVIDLFSGAGGLSLGFAPKFGHCFSPVWANDFNRHAAATYEENFGAHCAIEDVSELLHSGRFAVPKADVVIGGPPCQGFSLLNKNRANDPRRDLWREFLYVVEASGASVFVIENVPQLLGSPEAGEIADAAEALGFAVTSAKLLAADYGVAQRRSRAFIVGCRHADPSEVFPPKRTHIKPDSNTVGPEYVEDPEQWRTVRDAIGDLPRPVGTEIRIEAAPLNLQFGRNPTPKSKERYRTVAKEGMNRFDLQARRPDLTPGCWIRKTTGGTDLFGRLWWDRPAFTIRTEFFKPEKGRYLHPKQHRPITHREAARLQSFPDSFEFTGTKIEIARQIGNAVPPALAARIADSVYALLLAKK